MLTLPLNIYALHNYIIISVHCLPDYDKNQEPHDVLRFNYPFCFNLIRVLVFHLFLTRKIMFLGGSRILSSPYYFEIE